MPLLMYLPMGKFSIGCIYYLFSVLLLSIRDLDSVTMWRNVAIAIGGMLMLMTIVLGGILSAQDHTKTMVRSPGLTAS
jgi:hypothetical protein